MTSAVSDSKGSSRNIVFEDGSEMEEEDVPPSFVDF